MTLAALGVVYGDIGTSPLYAVRECFYGARGVAPTADNVFGVLSLVLWSLIFIIGIKYLVFVLRADHEGEGGILALMQLAQRGLRGRTRRYVITLGLFGAALLYGDGMITPAISVLSAVEGLKVATPVFEPYVVPITLVILVGLFAAQRLGTGSVGRLFGPFMLAWFFCIGAAGAVAILGNPAVLGAANPAHAWAFFAANGAMALAVLGIVFLVVTGGEALYADIGHFGRRPMRLGWYLVVLPGLLLNYFGQGALIIDRGAALSNPFYELVPPALLYPMVGLATAATIIASQAIISGVFSLTSQGVKLGYLPPVRVVHTSSTRHGQIYVPLVNWLLLAATAALVAGFRHSGNLAAAYGIAISATMLITTLLFWFVQRDLFRWPLAVCVAATAVFLVPDTAFFIANAGKFMSGGWLPTLVALATWFLMTTWRQGQRIERRKVHNEGVPVAKFLSELGGGYYRRVPGQAVYIVDYERGTPAALVHNLRHNRALHQRVVLYTAKTLRRPRIPDEERLEVKQLRDDIWRVVSRYGYLQSPDPPRDLAQADAEHGIGLDLGHVHYFVTRDVRLPSTGAGMNPMRAWFYRLLARNARRARRYGALPVEQVQEIGVRVRI